MWDQEGNTRWLVVVLFITALDHLMGCVSFIHTFLFNADIDRVASAVSYNSAQRTEDMLKQMQDLHRSGSRTVRPSQHTNDPILDRVQIS